VVGARNYVYGAGSDADGVAHAYEYATYNAYASIIIIVKVSHQSKKSRKPKIAPPYHKLHERRSPLMYTQPHGLQIELEENPRGASVMLEHASVMSDAVLVRVERGRARSDVGRWDYV
jgi:hypothetical protein